MIFQFLICGVSLEHHTHLIYPGLSLYLTLLLIIVHSNPGPKLRCVGYSGFMSKSYKHLKKSNAACFYTPIVLKLLIIVQM